MSDLSRIYAEIIERMPLGVVVWRLDDDGRTMTLVRGNSAAERLIGHDLVRSSGRAMCELFPVVTAERQALYVEVAETGVGRLLGETAYRGTDGSERAAASRVVALHHRCVAVIFEDVTERRRAVADLRRSEERFRTLIENSADGVSVTDAQGRIVYTSPSVWRMLGYAPSELEGRASFDLAHPEDLPLVRSNFVDVLANPGKAFVKQVRCRHRDGSWRHLELITVNRLDDPNLGGVVTNFRDVTDRVVMEEELRRTGEELVQAQKMEAIGKLAGGVAHDFNNLLSVILGTSILLLEKQELGDAIRTEIGEIKRAGERAAELTKQLLAFSRRQILAPRVLDLNDVLSNIERMLRRIIGEDVELRTLRSPRLSLVLVDPGQIEQILMNLVVNARDAMPNGGTLTIETRNAELDEAYAAGHPGVVPGPHVMLAISDTGTGMDRETRDHVFEPFFTTKALGKGTGLGLSSVFGMVKQSGGSIWLDSELGKGTTFKLYFPRTSSERETVPRPRAVARELRGSETILVVEDDAQVRVLVRCILEGRGYRVLDAGDPEAALRLCEARADAIDLLLTDVVMPKMSGRDLAKRVAAMRPATKVLYMSGYTDNTIVQHGVLEPGIALLQKPVTPDALSRKVRDVLEGR